VHELNFSEIVIRGRKIANQTNLYWVCCWARKGNEIRKKVTQAYVTFMYRNCFGSNQHIHYCVPFVYHETGRQKGFFSIILLHSLIKQLQTTLLSKCMSSGAAILQWTFVLCDEER
jgi:hypothetical protein